MRCLRHKIHMGLFCAFGLSALNWIFNKSLQSGPSEKNKNIVFLIIFTTSDLSSYMTASVFDAVYCTSWVLTFFFHLASFYWMFIEGKINQAEVSDKKWKMDLLLKAAFALQSSANFWKRNKVNQIKAALWQRKGMWIIASSELLI